MIQGFSQDNENTWKFSHSATWPVAGGRAGCHKIAMIVTNLETVPPQTPCRTGDPQSRIAEIIRP